MQKNSRTLFSIFFCLALIFHNNLAYSQLQSKAEQAEAFYIYWAKAFVNSQTLLNLNKEDYGLFCRFYSSKLDSLRGVYAREMGNTIADSAKGNRIMMQTENRIMALYRQFEKIKVQYPSSVNEYRRPHFFPQPVCDSTGCTNIGFENGTLSGWNAYYAYNSNNNLFNYFNVTNITGGPVGAVTEAANDVLTSTVGFYNNSLPPNPSPDYQVSIMSGLRKDALTNVIPVVSPFGGSYSVMLGDSTEVNDGVAILSKTFLVKPSNIDFTYQYAVVLENPQQHTFYEQPFFQVALLDGNGDTIPICGQYSVVSSGGASSGFTPVFVPPGNSVGNDTAYYRDWTIVSVPLKKYIGQCVTIIFEAGDCALGGHFGYAYVDATCAPFQIASSSPALCGQKSISLTGPPGFVTYKWTGPPGGIVGLNNTQSINVDSAGTYQLISIPVTGATCADTLSINIVDTTGPPPVPSFTINGVCQGQQIQFTNTSNPLNGPGVKYYWDFYNLGAYQDSTADPTWSFIRAGTYDIKLYEVNNGCGADTVIPITVYPPPAATINGPTIVCYGDSVTLNADITSTPLQFCYLNWSTGSTTPSTTFFPTPIDSLYYLVLNSGCLDTIYYRIHVLSTSPIQACCNTTITAGDTTTISASGENSYIWSPNSWLGCATCDTSVAYPRKTTTYYVTGTDNNGCKFIDSVLIQVNSCGNVFIPTAFTPNNDGRNDFFFPEGRCLSSYSMTIFDRWGNLLFTGGENQPWDGTVKGRKVLEDTYVYQMVLNTWDLQTKTVIGNVTVLR